MVLIGADSVVTDEGQTASFRLANDGDSSANLIFATFDGTASAASGDYVQSFGNLQIPPQSIQFKSVQTNVDNRNEGDETFGFLIIAASGTSLLEGAAAILATATIKESGGVGAVVDTQYLYGPGSASTSLPTLHVRDSAIYEGTSGSLFMPFLISLDRPANSAVTIGYKLEAGSAGLQDYAAVGSTVTIQQGAMSALVLVNVSGDTMKEGTETFHLKLTGVSGAVFAFGAGQVEATGSIYDSRSDGSGLEGVVGAFGSALFGERNDQITGSADADRIDGGGGQDQINGAGGDDSLSGGAGNDRLLGSAGKDKLDGGDGDDILDGGAASDNFVGGGGADRFAIGEHDSGTKRANADRVLDFSRAEHDRIDLSGIDAQAETLRHDQFTFIGQAAFSGKAGDLRYRFADGSTYVEGDTDGDRRADFSVTLTGAIKLRIGDFVLRSADGGLADPSASLIPEPTIAPRFEFLWTHGHADMLLSPFVHLV